MLTRGVNRTAQAQNLDEVVVATTNLPADDAVADLCRTGGFRYFRGSELDVLDRYYQAATQVQADVIVRVTADCPLIAPEIVDRVVEAFLSGQPNVAYASNIVPDRTFPRGLDTEVMSYDALESIWRQDQEPSGREHVTPYIHRHPELFKTVCVTNDEDLSALRWTVDLPEDLALVRRIYDHFGHGNFSWREALNILRSNPAWSEINQHVEQKAI